MKKINYALACGALLLASSVAAQTVTREVEITGDITSSYYSASATYRLVLELDESVSPSNQSLTSIDYNENGYLVAASLNIYDASGEEAVIVGGFRFTGESYNYLNYYQDASSESINFSLYNGVQGDIGVYIQGTELFELFAAQPTFTSSPETLSFYMHYVALDQLSQNWIHDDPDGNVLSIGNLITDSDGDGLADDVDACVASNLDETVAFGGWYETGVTNYMDESGCSIMDHYAACEAESESTAPAGPVFSSFAGPSYCETSVGYSLQGEGVIDYTESRMLRNALYNYHRSGGNGPS